jgi:hypothetical protein
MQEDLAAPDCLAPPILVSKIGGGEVKIRAYICKHDAAGNRQDPMPGQGLSALALRFLPPFGTFIKPPPPGVVGDVCLA